MSMTSTTAANSATAVDRPVTPDAILQLGTAYWGSKTLLSAVELKLFGALAEAGPLDEVALRRRLGLNPRGSRDFFDALVALGMLERQDGRYSNTEATALFLDPAKPTYVGGMLEMGNSRLYHFWGSLTDALRTGEPQSEIKAGGDFFTTLYADSDRLTQFASAMSGLSTAAAQAIAANFPWGDHRSVTDVGCAQGAILATIAAAHGHLEGTGFDLPPLQPIFDAHVERHGLADRLSFTPGDFTTDPLPPADVIVMGHILDGHDLADKKMLLQKAYDALPRGGALIVYESIIDDERRHNAFGLLMSLTMLIEGDGFIFTGADCRRWMAETGFSDSYVAHLVGPDSMVVGIK